MTDAVAPVLRVMSEPAAAISNVVSNVRELAAIREQNADLREDNERLLSWQAAAQKLERENRALRSLLSLVPDPSASFITGRVIADAGGAFAQSVVVMAGASDGARKGQVVMTGEGLVGRVMSVGGYSSRVLLITDINSRIPVR
ncbi:MAG: rod shape-determining protein MreC, partial [Rhodospirillaceae bacterium]